MGEVYTVTIDDASSIINWHPQGTSAAICRLCNPLLTLGFPGDGGIGNFTAYGWQPFYSGSPGGFTTSGGEAALGESVHITAFPNATFDFQFYGEQPISLPSLQLD